MFVCCSRTLRSLTIYGLRKLAKPLPGTFGIDLNSPSIRASACALRQCVGLTRLDMGSVYSPHDLAPNPSGGEERALDALCTALLAPAESLDR